MSREHETAAGSAPGGERAYWAFLSYSHRDQEFGAWLHRRLETWKVPGGIAARLTPTSPAARHLYPIFRDREELPTSADLGGSIRRALAASRHLIVVCSPASAASHWVNEEVKSFQALGRQDRILCVIVAGEPNAAGKAGFRPEEECFCPALRVRVGPDGRPTAEPNEPIAADVRPGGDSRRVAILKLCAGLLGVDFARLADRVRRRRRARLLAWAAVLLVLLGAAAFFVEKNARDRESERAGFREDTRTQARLAAARESAERGERAAEEGRPREALAWFAEALEQDPGHSGAAERLASVLQHVGFALPVVQEPGPFARRKAFLAADGSSEFLGVDEENRLRRFDAKSGEPTSEPLQEGEVQDWALAAGGSRLAVLTQIVHGSGGARFASNLRWLAIYDLRTGRPLAPPEKTYFSRVVATPTDATFVFGVEQGSAGEGHLERWDAERGVRVGEPFELENTARAIALDPAGKRVAVAAMDGRVRVHEVGTWALVGEPFRGGDDAEEVAWSGDSRSLAAGFHDGTARIWDAASGVQRTAPLLHGAPLTAVALSPDGRRLATVAGWSAARLWDATNGTLLAGPVGTEGELATVAFSSNGALLLVAVRDGTARVIDANTGRAACETLEVAGGIARAAWQGDRVRTVSLAGTAYVWEVRGRAAAPLALAHEGDVLDFDVSEDGKRIATGSADGTARVWDATSGELLTRVAPGAPVREVAFRYEGERIRTSTDGGAQQWDARTGAPLEGQGTEGGVSGLDASTWFRRTDDGNVWIKVSDWRRVEFFPRGHAKDAEPPSATLASRVTEVAFGADDTLVAIGTAEGTVHVFEMGTGRARGRAIVHAAEVTGVAFAPTGGVPRLATASRDGTARLWDVDTGWPRGEPLRHPGPVVELAFLPDGRLLAAAGRAAHLWDVDDLPTPAPAWLPAFARSVARRRVAHGGGIVETPADPLSLLAVQRALVGAATATDPWARLGAWFTAESAARTRAPLAR